MIITPKRLQRHPPTHQPFYLLPTKLIIILRHDFLDLAVEGADGLGFLLAGTVVKWVVGKVWVALLKDMRDRTVWVGLGVDGWVI